MGRVEAMALLVAAVDTGSLSGGARRSGLSLSSVSRHLAALEERLGIRLLLRNTRSLALTEAGRVYYEKAKRLLAEIDEMEASLDEHAAAPVGRLQVGGPTLFGRVYLLPILARFAQRYPKLSLDVTLLDRPFNLIEEGFDLAVRIGEIEDSSLVTRKLGALRWVLAAAPSYLAERGEPRSVADLVHHDCLVYSQQPMGAEWRILQDGRPTQVRVPMRMRANTLDGVVAAAAEGAGLVHAPAWSVAPHVAAGRLRVVLREIELPPLPIRALLTHNRLLSGKVRLLLDYMTTNLAGIDFDALPSPADG
jgi:DNA-binding transcriptional LysR family regulator